MSGRARHHRDVVSVPRRADVDAYWRNILGKVDAVSDPPPEAWDPDVYYDPEFENRDATYCKRGGYLGSLATFDPLAHGIPPVAVGGAGPVARPPRRPGGPGRRPCD